MKVFEVKDLVFTYPKQDKAVVKGISFCVNQGEIYGFLGPSGAGKSTTQKILTKLLSNFSGEIVYMGKNLKEMHSDFYEEIGVGFELPVHFSKLTAMENLTFFQSLYKNKAEIEGLLKRLNLYEDKDKKVSEFSKGMKMRLNFARALLNNPKFLFLDEPTNGLDPVNAKIIKDMIIEFKENGGTVFLTTHLMSDVERLCDRVAFLNDGKIVETDTPKNLKIKYGKRHVEVEVALNGKTEVKSFELHDLGYNEAFISTIKDKEIITIHSGETTLEDIFIKVTGVKAYETA